MCNCLAPAQPLVRLAFAGPVSSSMAKQRVPSAWWDPEPEPTDGGRWSQRRAVQHEATPNELAMYGKWQPYQWEPWLLQLDNNGTKKPTGLGWTKLAWMEWYVKMNIIMRNIKKESRLDGDEERCVQEGLSSSSTSEQTGLLSGLLLRADRLHLEVMMVTARLSSSSTSEQTGLRRFMSGNRSRSRSPDRSGGP
eukprot:4633812-Heterocapsa_arctica.AAC.1